MGCVGIISATKVEGSLKKICGLPKGTNCHHFSLLFEETTRILLTLENIRCYINPTLLPYFLEDKPVVLLLSLRLKYKAGFLQNNLDFKHEFHELKTVFQKLF